MRRIHRFETLGDVKSFIGGLYGWRASTAVMMGTPLRRKTSVTFVLRDHKHTQRPSGFKMSPAPPRQSYLGPSAILLARNV